MGKIIKSIYYSFPVQLVLLHLKKHPLMLILWFSLFAIVTNLFGSVFGLNFLFLDPEYLGKVNFWSFFLIGLMLGLFIMAFHISSYMLNSFRFPFLATLKYPLAIFVINNSIIPAAFLITYSTLLVIFQYNAALALELDTFFNIVALLLGLTSMILFFGLYFSQTNKNVFVIIGIRKANRYSEKRRLFNWTSVQRSAKLWQVDNFLTAKFRIRPVRGVEHYDEKLLLTVFKQHHYNALLIQVLSIALLISLGALADYKAFIVPAGASILILFSILIMMVGAFTFWTKGWQAFAFIALIIALATVFNFDFLNYKNQVYGINYEGEKAAYNYTALSEAASETQIAADKEYTLQILENWSVKNSGSKGKPKMIFINATGGGHRASVWTFKVLQELDSMFNGQLMEQTMLISGASGGMLAAAYFRELYLRKKQGEFIDLQDEQYISNIGKDLLNPVSFMIVSNDIFYPWRKYEYDGYTYRKDRGYIFEKYYNLNTDSVLNKKLLDYRKPEFESQIPMMVLSPTIIKDEKMLFVSPQPVTYLTRPSTAPKDSFAVDGIDFGAFFKEQNSYNLKMTSALRMNATYPYVLPPVSLPTEPTIFVMDAGLRDNFGIQTSIRFIDAFKEWIRQNTDGIILISINSANPSLIGMDINNSGLMNRLFNPVGNIYLNWIKMQSYYQKYLFHYANEWFDGKADFIEFNYIPREKDQPASMSFHLTAIEKKKIAEAIHLEINQDAFKKLQSLMAQPDRVLTSSNP